MIIRPCYDSDREQLILLIADFRVVLAEFKGLKRPPDLERARQELTYYLTAWIFSLSRGR